MSGGSAAIRSSPSTTSTSLATARVLSFVRAFASAASARFASLSALRLDSCPAVMYSIIWSASSRSYHASSTRDSAARSIRSR